VCSPEHEEQMSSLLKQMSSLLIGAPFTGSPWCFLTRSLGDRAICQIVSAGAGLAGSGGMARCVFPSGLVWTGGIACGSSPPARPDAGPPFLRLFGGRGDAAEVSVFEAVAVAFE
jgi:hypothetical protein